MYIIFTGVHIILSVRESLICSHGFATVQLHVDVTFDTCNWEHTNEFCSAHAQARHLLTGLSSNG